MLTTLWIITVAAVVAMGAAIIGRNAVATNSNRVELERSRWMALGCARRAQAAIDDVLRTAPTADDAAAAWRALADRVSPSPLLQECEVTLEAVGTRLDVNAATEEMLTRLLNAVEAGDAEDRAAAFADWRDSDDVARPLGAERPWYVGAGRLPPRNGPIADVAELRRIRGFESGGSWETLLGVDSGRVSLATAPVEVLMAVPGITRETAEQIVQLRERGAPVPDLSAIIASISEASSAELASRYPEASRAVTADPDAWIIRVRAKHGQPPVGVLLEWRVIRVDRHCAITGLRSRL